MTLTLKALRFCGAVCLFVLLYCNAEAQFPAPVQDNINRQIPNPLPPSPNVASLGKFGDYKVSYFTGVPEISIPIYEVKSGNLSVPITLSYHASGIKPTDVASWVGSGWALSAGGQISRSVRGKPDEVSYSSQALRTSTPVCGPSGTGAFSYLKDITTGIIDTDPDVFSYSYPGGNGKFIKPYNESPYLIPYAPIVINPFSLDKFEITSEAGVLHKFGTTSAATESTFAQSGGNPTTGNTAWLLTDMVDSNSDDQISFTYQSVGQVHTHDVTYVQTIIDRCYLQIPPNTQASCPPIPAPQSINVDSNTSQKGLQTIFFETGKVEFVLTSAFRSDQTQLKALDSIVVYGKMNGAYYVSKSIKFVYSYFKDAANGDSKLKLDAVLFRGSSGPVVQRYRLTYFTDSFPWNPASNWLNQRDLWGYYNGASNTDLILPKTVSFQAMMSSPETAYSFGGAFDRNVNTQFIKHGVLKRIDFPTGGYTEFDYESNKYLDLDGTPKLTGGLRVTRIASSDENGSPPVVKTYKYGYNESGYGTPNFTPWQFNYSSEQNYYSDCLEGLVAVTNYRSRSYYSQSAYAFDSSPILYGYVTEYTGDVEGNYLGKTIYEYDAGFPSPDNIDQIVPNTGSYYKVSLGWTRGKLTRKTVYGIASNILSESEYFYTLANATAVKHIGIGAAEYITGNNPCSFSPATGGMGTPCLNDIGESANIITYFSTNYTQNSGIYLQTKVTDKLYENGVPGNVVVTTKDVAYTTNTQPKTTKVINGNKSEQTITTNTYPYELSPNASSTGAAKGLYMLNNKHIWSQPVETYTYVESTDNTNQRITSGQVVTFKMNPNAVTNVVLDSIYILEGALPFPKASYAPIGIHANNNWITKNSNYKARAKLTDYDSYGHVTSVAKVKDVMTSYVYGYNNAIPIVKATNAAPNEIKYVNFEEPAAVFPITNSPTAHSGKQYYSGDYTVTFAIPNARAYRVDYWYLDDVTSRWVYKSKPYTGASMSLSEGIAIDDVRICPLDAQISTYTYDVANGTTSATDSNGRMEFYEYDLFGRLQLTRDTDGNIVKTYLYHYRE